VPAPAPDILIEPGAAPTVLRRDPPPISINSTSRDLDAPIASLRTQLGLPTDRPIVMTGHQCAIWHPGILAKHLACWRLARRDDARAVRLWVDQDDNDPLTIDLPTRRDGRLARTPWRLAPDVQSPPGSPTGWRPPITGVAPAPPDICAVAHGSIERIAGAISAHADAPSLGAQFAMACAALMPQPTAQSTPPPSRKPMLDLFASALASTDLFIALVDLMREDPGACVSAYNDASSNAPGAGVRPLRLNTNNPGATELPLWRCRAGEPRMPVRAGMLGAIPIEQLAPRALLMTGMLRLGACDLFIHGTGGGAYDEITERWFERWLASAGAQGRLLAPKLVVSATVTLPLADGDAPTAQQADEARQLARRARHDPAILVDHDASEAKMAMLREIEDCKAGGGDPAPIFARMKTLLADYAQRHAPALAKLDAEADAASRLAAERDIITDRTWAFALHEPEAMAMLDARLAQALDNTTTPDAAGAAR